MAISFHVDAGHFVLRRLNAPALAGEWWRNAIERRFSQGVFIERNRH